MKKTRQNKILEPIRLQNVPNEFFQAAIAVEIIAELAHESLSARKIIKAASVSLHWLLRADRRR